MKLGTIIRTILRPIKTRIHKLHGKALHYSKTIYFKLHFQLVESQWSYSQKQYVKWTRTQLPDSYIKQIQRLGTMFKDFIGEQGFCLDVGCGNGEISNTNYEGIDYTYLSKPAVGIDPLRCIQKPPWINCYVQAIAENMPFRNESFDTITFATSLDHVGNVEVCLQECRRVLKHLGKINIWTTCLKGKIEGDFLHSTRLREQSLEASLLGHFQIVDKFVEPFSDTGDTIFIKAVKT